MTWTRVLWIAAVVAALAVAIMAFGRFPQTGEAWRLQTVPPVGWLLAAAGMAVSYAMRALRLRAEWQGERDLKAGRCLQVILMHAAAVNLLPMRTGELGFPWLLNRHWRIPLPDATSSLMWMRLQDVVVLAWLCALSALAVLAASATIDIATAVGGALLACAVLLAWAMRGAAWSRAFLARRTASTGDRSRIRRWLALAGSAAVQGSARANRSTWAWSVGNWIVKIAALGGLLCALTGNSASAGWCGALGGEVAGALPVQPPAGFGSYEAAVALAASLAGGGPPQRLLAAAVVVHLFVLASSLVGAALAWLSVPRSADARSAGDAT